MRLFKSFFTLLFLCQLCVAQGDINKMDENGKRHGLWRGLYDESKRVRYEGTFDHGKETGIFTYYDDTKAHTVVATRDFSKGSDSPYTKFFDPLKNLVSEGMLVDKKPHGKWIYYHKASKAPMSIEFYNNGVLDKKREVFYPNGKPAEETNYNNGVKDGPYKKYSEKGIVLEEVNYVNGEIEGLGTYRDIDGNIVSQGQYKKGLKNGVWKFYEGGKLIRQEKHPVVKKFAKRKLK